MSAPFSNIPSMVEHMVACALPPHFKAPQRIKQLLRAILRLVVPHQWDNIAKVPATVGAGWQLGIVHGARDELVPVEMSHQLHQLALRAHVVGVAKPIFIESKRAGHNDVLMRSL